MGEIKFEAAKPQPSWQLEPNLDTNVTVLSNEAYHYSLGLKVHYRQLPTPADVKFDQDDLKLGIKIAANSVLANDGIRTIYNQAMKPDEHRKLEERLNSGIGAMLSKFGIVADGVEITSLGVDDAALEKLRKPNGK